MKIDLRLLQNKNAAFLDFNIKEEDFLSENNMVLRVKTGIIYVIVNLVNGKVYVGLSRKSFYGKKGRYRKAFTNSNNEHFLNAIKKYGKENFTILIMEENRGINILNILETYYILKFRANNEEFGYNKTLGGEGNIVPIKIKEKHDREKKDQFIQKSKNLYGNDAFQYIEIKINDKSKIKLICNTCNHSFWQRLDGHLNSICPCPKCSYKDRSKKREISFAEFADRAKEKHGDSFEYHQAQYVNMRTKMPIKHKKCGSIYVTTPSTHTKHSCPTCSEKEKSSPLFKKVKININDQIHMFSSIRNAQRFLNEKLGTNCDGALKNQIYRNENQFHYKGFGIQILN